MFFQENSLGDIEYVTHRKQIGVLVNSFLSNIALSSVFFVVDKIMYTEEKQYLTHKLS